MNLKSLLIGVVLGYGLALILNSDGSPAVPTGDEELVELAESEMENAPVQSKPEDVKTPVVQAKPSSPSKSKAAKPQKPDEIKIRITVADLLEKALELQTDGNTSDAFELFRKIEKLAPNNEDFLFNYSTFLEEKRLGDQARTYLERCVKNHPTSFKCHSELSAQVMANGTIEERKKAVTRCLTQTPGNFECTHDLASLSESEGNHQKAYETYKKLLDTGDRGEMVNQDYLQYRLALAAERMENMEQAVEHYQQACSLRIAEACERLRALDGQPPEGE